MITKKHILLIDDDEDEAYIFMEALRDIYSSYQCDWATNAEQGMQLLGKGLPDIVFLDINMPKIDGFDCLGMIRKKEEFKEIPIVIYTTGFNKQMERKALEMGAVGCLQKTNSIGVLSKILKAVLEQEQTLQQ